jgi:hypothetical protein
MSKKGFIMNLPEKQGLKGLCKLVGSSFVISINVGHDCEPE